QIAPAARARAAGRAGDERTDHASVLLDDVTRSPPSTSEAPTVASNCGYDQAATASRLGPDMARSPGAPSASWKKATCSDMATDWCSSVLAVAAFSSTSAEFCCVTSSI